jgi:phosphonate transport system permease protein
MASPVAAGTARPAEPEILLVASRLSVRFAGCQHCAIEAVDLAIAAGERIAIVGPSGGGKTTLLRALEGSIAPTSGTVERTGTVALVHQDLRLVAEETVLANVCSGGMGASTLAEGLAGWSDELRERARELIADLGIGELEEATVGTLSGGQRQRVAIARALCARPRILLADEPMAALDPENSLRILRLLSRLQARHRFALVLTIHDPGPAPEFFQRVFVVRDGRVVERDTGVLDNWHEIFAADLSEEEDVPPGGQDRALARRPGLFQRLATPATVAAVIGAIVWSGASLDLKGASLANAGSGFLDLVRRMVPGSLAEAAALPWATLAAALAQTVQMALVGTALGAVASLPLALMASGATAPLWLRAPMRLALNAVRTVPSVFWALIFVAVTGLGPLAGVLALAAYSCGYLTKFFYESLEDADGRPAAALRQLGASRLQAFRRGVWPASKPSLLASTFFVFEYNIRAASILGVVGAGGIGADLMYYIEWRQFPSAAAGLLLILAVVVALDAVSRLLRARLGEARGR